MAENVAALIPDECEPCRRDAECLSRADLRQLHARLDSGWWVIDEHHLEKIYKFKNFKQALDFTNQVGELAEMENHHPDISLSWGKVVITICTHRTDCLTRADFAFASKVEAMGG